MSNTPELCATRNNLKSRSVWRLIALGPVFLATVALGQYWDLDPAFAPALESNASSGGGVSPCAYPGGRLLVNTSYDMINGQPTHWQLTRLNADGSVDNGFNRPGQAEVLQVFPDGRILVLDTYTNEAGFGRVRVRRLLADGAVDPDFNGPEVGFTSVLASLVLEDGRILLHGGLSTTDDVATIGLIVLQSNGSVDPSFQSPLSGGSIYVACQLPDGKILIGGSFVTQEPTGLDRVARLNLDGSIDLTFNATDTGFTAAPTRLYREDDGHILLASGSEPRIIRLSPIGARDMGFSPALVGSNWDFGPRQSDGKIFYTTMVVGSPSLIQLRRMHPDGSDDASFPIISTPYATGYQIGQPLLSDDGTFFVGPMTAERESARHKLTHVLADGSIDSGFNPRFARFASVDAFIRQTDGRLLIAGRWDHINNTPISADYSLVRLNNDGTLDPTFTATLPTDTSIDKLVIQPGGKILAFGGFPNGVEGAETVRRFDPNGNADASFQAITQTLFVREIDSAGYIYAAPSGPVQRYTPDGVPDPTFQSDAAGPIKFIAPLSDGAVLVARDIGAGGFSIARLLHDGTSDPGFVPPPASTLIALVGLPDGRALICDQRHAGSAGYFFSLKRLRADGTFDFNYATRMTPGNVPGLDIQKAIAGVLFDLLREASPNTLATVWADFSPVWSVARMKLDCHSDGEFVLWQTGSSSSPPYRYLRTALSGPSAEMAPCILEMSQPRWLLRPLNYVAQLVLLVPGGLAPFTYQWSKDGVPIPGRTLPELQLTVTDASDAGNYSVTITNAYGAVTSADIPLTVDTTHTIASISIHPTGRTTALGSSTVFTVIATGNPAPLYQWKFNGVNITGATDASLALSDVQQANAGTYTVQVRNTVSNAAGNISGSQISQPAVLTVVPGFNSWRQSQFTPDELLDANVSGPSAIYGQDGLPNLVKYALGLEPKQNITTGLPVVSTTATDWVYTYVRPDSSAGITDVTYTVQYSTDLTTWTPLTDAFVANAGGFDTRQATYPLASATRIYFRLSITHP